METIDRAALGGIEPQVYARRKLILFSMCLSLVLIVATVSSLNVAIPSLAAGLSPTPSDTEILWIVDAYALVFAAVLLPAGALGDRFGRKGALLLGLFIFGGASTLCTLTDHPSALIALRATMGVGAALIMPSTLSLLQASFPPAERPRAIAVWAAFAGAGGALGPLMGGLLLDHFWFGSVFLVAVPIAAVAFVTSAIVAPKSKESGKVALDPIGSALSVVGFGALLLAIIEGPARGWTDSLVVAGFVVAAAALTAFVMYERAAANPMLDMRYFSNPRFASGSLGITLTFMAMFAMFFMLTQYFQYVRGHSALAASVRQLPSAAMMILVSPRSAALAARFGARRVVLPGAALVATGLLMLSFADRDSPYLLVLLALMAMGTGLALSTPSLSTSIVQSVPMNKAGVGSAVNDTTREVGGAIGIALVGSIVTSVYRHHLSPALEQLPAAQADLARDNVAKAVGVAERSGAPGLVDAVRNAYVSGVHVGFRVAAGVALISLIVLAFKLPDEAGDRRATDFHG